jgi:hypothetical protein
MCALLASATVNFTTPQQSPLGHDDKDDDTYFDMWLFGTHAYSTTDMSLSLLHLYFGQKNQFHDDGGTVRVAFDLNSRTNPTDNSPLDKDTFSFCGLGLQIHPNGHDTWIFQPTITLIFDDGTGTTLSPATATYLVSQDSLWMHSQFQGSAPTLLPQTAEPVAGQRPFVPVGPQVPIPPNGIADPFVGAKKQVP